MTKLEKVVNHFGRLGVAMITPFTGKDNDKLDIDAALYLADRLINNGCDCLVLSGTTGESPTTTQKEKLLLLKEISAIAGGRAKIVQGVGTNNTAATLTLLKDVEKLDCDGLLVVTPYYSKPSQAGLVAHYTKIAQNTQLPIMLYDIPGRSCISLAKDTILRLAELENIWAIKDAKGDISQAISIMEVADIAYYSGDDPLNFAWLCAGALGVVSVIAHFVAPQIKKLMTAISELNITLAREICAALMPIAMAVGEFGGVAMVKSGLKLLEHDFGTPRLPLVELANEQKHWLNEQLVKLKVVL